MQSSRRFYNAALRDVYGACVLPTDRPFSAAPHAVQTSLYVQHDIRRSAFTQTEFVLPPGHTRPPPYATPLSLPFYKLARAAEDDAATTKRRKTNGGGDGAEKKAAPFSRKAPLDGQLRVLKILMLPTGEQRVEMRRCFSMARLAYNTSNWMVKKDKRRPNAIELRAAWRALPRPHWSNTKETKVHTEIEARAIKQLADAYTSNYAKQRKDPSHRFDVGYRSLKKSPTETLVLCKDGNNNAAL